MRDRRRQLCNSIAVRCTLARIPIFQLGQLRERLVRSSASAAIVVLLNLLRDAAPFTIDHRGNAIERTLGSLPSTDRISSPTTIRYRTSIVALTITALASEADSRKWTENGQMIRAEGRGGGRAGGGLGSRRNWVDQV